MLHSIALPLGIDDFETVISEGYYFVDKSRLICEIIDDDARVILLPRPRRFGKTLNLSMLYYYFVLDPEERYHELFKNLAISQTEEAYTQHQNRYPVIFFTLKDIKDATYNQAYQAIGMLMAELYNKHCYLLDNNHLAPHEKDTFQQIMTETSTEAHLKNSLKTLITYLYRYHGIKPILLLDEYDSPIHTAYECGYYNDMVRFMQVFLGGALKGNKYLHKAVITGILRVAQASIFSGLNNIVVHSILSTRYSQYFGFLEKEVRILCEHSGGSHTMDEIRQWYNGYQFGQTQVYNPWSILNYLYFKKSPQPYWINVANNSLIKKLVAQSKNDVKSQFEHLLQGQPITQTITDELVFPQLSVNEGALWNLLLFTGYLTLSSLDLGVRHNNAQLRIPNKEVQYLFEDMVEEWFSTEQLSLKSYHELLQSLVQHNTTTFAQLLQTYIRESGSYFDFNQHTPEQVYHALVLGLVVGLRDQFYIQSNRESGDGRFDVCLFPKQTDQTGILMEFKQTPAAEQLEQTAAAALAQIEDQRYDTAFRQRSIPRVLCLGVAFAARDVKIASSLRELPND